MGVLCWVQEMGMAAASTRPVLGGPYGVLIFVGEGQDGSKHLVQPFRAFEDVVLRSSKGLFDSTWCDYSTSAQGERSSPGALPRRSLY